MKHHISWHGVFAVLATPFHDDLSIDVQGLVNQVDFCLECKVHGLVAPVIASEFFTLSDSERIEIFRLVAKRTRGILPFVAGVSGVSIPQAVMLAEAAADAGANALIAMPPYVGGGSTAMSIRYYEAIGRAVDLPLMVQNAPDGGSPMSTNELVSLIERVANIETVKEETPPNPQRVGAIVAAAGDRIKGVFGGHGGIYLFNELARGARGTMPACEFADVAVQIYNNYHTGNIRAARQIYSALQPALVMEKLYGIAFVKECLYRRGLIAGTAMRAPGPDLDAIDRAELDHLWRGLEAHFAPALKS
jgi:dihydrodipicolinate synthase/N-acetylneuraminate lyase